MTIDDLPADLAVQVTSQRPLAVVSEARRVEVFRRRDAAAWGVDPASVRTYVRQGLWTRLHRGVYADTSVLQAARERPEKLHRLLAQAAIAALPIQAYAVGPTGALAHGLPLPSGLPSVVSIVRTTGADQRALRRKISHASALAGVQVLQHRLTDSHVTEIDGLAVVTRDVAAVTSAARCSLEWAVALLDAVSWQRIDADAALKPIIDDWSQLRGVGVVREALGLSRSGAQSPFESLTRVRLVGEKLPEPRLQAACYDDEGLIGHVDMLWDDWRVIAECDGALKYDNREALLQEKRREDRLRARGFVVVRLMWRDVMTNPAQVAARIHRARAQAQSFR